jgi:hypothetical protein
MVLTLVEKQTSGWYWKVPALLDAVQPKLTEQAVSEAEAQLGVKLPESYLVLLRRQNGGYLRATWPASYSRMLRGIGPNVPSITLDQDAWRPRNLGQASWVPRKAELLIPFDGDEHWSMCFDYRKRGPQGEPSITFVDSEGQEEEPVAQSFAAFLAGLVDEHAKSARIYGEVAVESIARALAEQLGAPPPRVDQSSSAYTRWRIALKGDHQWCWVSPNRVPAGFRRAEETGEVVVTEEMAFQLPEDPECAALVSCTDDSRAAVSNGIQGLGLGVGLASA